jgi:hypothetical protein
MFKGGDAKKKPQPKLFGVPLEQVPLHEAVAPDGQVFHIPLVVKETIEWIRARQGMLVVARWQPLRCILFADGNLPFLLLSVEALTVLSVGSDSLV